METEEAQLEACVPDLSLVKTEGDSNAFEQDDRTVRADQSTAMVGERTVIALERHNFQNTTTTNTTSSGNSSNRADLQRHNLLNLTGNLKDRGSLLWNELSQLLTQFHAELQQQTTTTNDFKTESETTNRTSSNSERLRKEVLGKEKENIRLRRTLNEMESHGQSLQMDISVKDSLLSKYQQDLMEKEANVLSLQSLSQKLESRISVLENKLHQHQQQQQQQGSSMTSRVTWPARMTSWRGMGSGMTRGGLKKRSLPMTGLGNAAKRPQIKSPISRATHRQSTPTSIDPPTVTPTRLAAPTDQASPMRLPTVPPQRSPIVRSSHDQHTTSGDDGDREQIVCIELDDDDEISEVTRASQGVSDVTSGADPNEALYAQPPDIDWQEGDGGDLGGDHEDETKPELQQSSSMGGDYLFDPSQYVEDSNEYDDVSQPLMLVGPTSDDPGSGGGVGGGDGMENDTGTMSSYYDANNTSSAGMQAAMVDFPGQMKTEGGRKTGKPSARPAICPLCRRLFHDRSTMRRHYRAKHEAGASYQCQICRRTFKRRYELDRHQNVSCATCSGTFGCREDLKAHTASCTRMAALQL